MPALVSAFCVLVTIGFLSLYGRISRANWQLSPTVTRYFADGPSATAIVYIPGAFNSAFYSSRGLRELWKKYGDVYLVEYPLSRFNLDLSVDEIARTLTPFYERVIVVGASLGGIIGLHLTDKELRVIYEDDEIYFIGCDVPQSKEHVHWAARLVRFVHPGPFINLLSPLVTKQVFRPQYDKLSPSSDGDDERLRHLLDEHVAAMRRFKLSAMGDQLSAIVEADTDDTMRFPGIRAVHLVSEDDAVIKSELAQEAFTRVFPNSTSIIIPRAFHATFMEHDPEWKAGFIEAFKRLGVPAVA